MRLKELRKERKLTQEQVANYLNLAQSTYQHYENGRAEPSIETLFKLADLYQVTLDYLLEREYNNEIGYLTTDQRNAIFIIKKLNQENLNNILSNALKLLDNQK